MDEQIKSILQRYEQSRTARLSWEPTYEQLRFYVWPSAGELVEKRLTSGSEGQIYTTNLADTTAIQASIRMAAGIVSYLMPLGIHWFEFQPIETDSSSRDFSIQKELSLQTQAVHQAVWRSNFQREIFLAVRSLVVFGTACISVEEKDGDLVFITHPIQDVYFEEDSKKRISAVFRRYVYTTRQIIELFGPEKVPPEWNRSAENSSIQNRTWEVLHAVVPSEEYNPDKIDSKKYDSYYILVHKNHLLERGGFRSMPYMIGRYDRSPGEMMGRSPAMELLADIKMLNQMRKTFLRSAEIVSNPPIIVDDDPMMEQPEIAPGSILIRQPGGKDPTPLAVGVNPALTGELIEIERKNIRDGFFNDLFQALADYRNMTAFEVAQRVEEKMVLLAPILSGLQKELLDPLILRVRGMLIGRSSASSYSAPYWSTRGQKIKIVYQSRLAMSMSVTQTNSLELWLNRWLPIQNLHPVLDILDMDKAAQRAALFSGVPADLLRSDSDIRKIRQERQDKIEEMQSTEQIRSVAESLKNISPFLTQSETVKEQEK